MTMGTVPHFKKKWFLCCQARRWTVASVLYQDGRHVGETNLISALLALWLAQPALDVGGDSTCPSPAEVRERLGEIADVGAKGTTTQSDRHRANLSSVGGKVHVELLGEDGRLLSERTLDQTGSCADVSLAVAVVLSTWEAEFNPHIAASVVLPPPAEPERAETLPAVVAKAHAPEAPLRFDVGLALLGSLAGGEVVPGTRLEGSLFPTSGSLGLGAALSASSTHSQSVDASAGDVHWMRVALTVGPKYRFGQGATMLELFAGGVIAVLHVEGVGIPSSSADTSAQLGIAAGLRGLWAWNNAAAWLGLDALAFPGRDSLEIGGVGDVGQLPRLEIQIASGVSLGRFP